MTATGQESSDSELLRNLNIAPGSLIGKCIRGLELENARMRLIENAALRVASARRDGIVTDRAVLDALDVALEARS